MRQTIGSRDVRNSPLRRDIDDAVRTTPVFDLHTHIVPPRFGASFLSGIDELVTYHYLVAEYFRASNSAPREFWALPKTVQADRIWEELFVRNTPLSEAARGVVNVLASLGLDPNASDLTAARTYFDGESPDARVARAFELGGVSAVVMTNDPFDPVEAATWAEISDRDPRFHAALRLDVLLMDWVTASETIARTHGTVPSPPSEGAASAGRRFLDEWIERMQPLYMAVSLPPDWTYADESVCSFALREIVLPTARAHGLPFALMIGAIRGVNPELRVAGDGVGRADVRAVEQICRENPDVRFLVTMLSRENQHELCVAARKFANLTPFGCWWFLNNPSIVAEITAERLELLGSTFIPQHSDARILEQLIYKWDHSRRAIADALFDGYRALAEDGFIPTREMIDRDAARLLSGNARSVLGLSAEEASSR